MSVPFSGPGQALEKRVHLLRLVRVLCATMKTDSRSRAMGRPRRFSIFTHDFRQPFCRLQGRFRMVG